MAINQDTLSGKWKEIKGEITRKWGQLRESDLDETKGNAESLTGLLQQKLGLAKDEASRQLSDIAARYENEGSQTQHNIADKANAKIDEWKDKLRDDDRRH